MVALLVAEKANPGAAEFRTERAEKDLLTLTELPFYDADISSVQRASADNPYIDLDCSGNHKNLIPIV